VKIGKTIRLPRKWLSILLLQHLPAPSRDRRKRFPFAYGICFLFLPIAVAQSLSPPPQDRSRDLASPASADFVAKNDANHWAIAAEITGTLLLEPQSVKVLVKSATLTRPARYNDSQDLVSIVAGIARELPGDTWDIVRPSEPYTFAHHLAPGDRVDLPPFQVTIPLEQFQIREGDWIAFEVSNAFVRDGRKSSGLVPVHARITWPDQFLLSRKNEISAPTAVFPPPPTPTDPQPILRELRGALQRGDLVTAADVGSKVDSAVHQQLNSWLIRDARERVEEVLSWFPVDFESIWVNQTPLPFTTEPVERLSQRPTIAGSLDRLAALDQGKYYRALAGRTSRLTVAAGRNIGEQPGGAWRITAQDVIYLYFLDAPAELPQPDESMLGMPVWRGVAKVDSGEPFRRGVERAMRDDENWIALARPDLIVLTNRRDLLNDTLSRIVNGSSTRAFPPSLPEWKQVDRQASFWGLRHYRDSSRPPANQRGFPSAYLPWPDGYATGCSVQFYDAVQRVEIRYMSAAQIPAGPANSIRRQFKIDQPQPEVWRLVSDVQQRGPWPLQLALAMLGFGDYR
jgi:hypothetical protein